MTKEIKINTLNRNNLKAPLTKDQLILILLIYPNIWD